MAQKECLAEARKPKPEASRSNPASRSRGNFPCPLLRLPVETADFFGIQMQTLNQAIRLLPLPTLVGEYQLIHGSQHARLSQQYRFGFAIQRNSFEHVRHLHFEHYVDQREQPEQKQIR